MVIVTCYWNEILVDDVTDDEKRKLKFSSKGRSFTQRWCASGLPRRGMIGFR
jgi:hypothetical protein